MGYDDMAELSTYYWEKVKNALGPKDPYCPARCLIVLLDFVLPVGI